MNRDGKNRGDVAAAYRRSKRVGEGLDTWLMVSFICARHGAVDMVGRGVLACGTDTATGANGG